MHVAFIAPCLFTRYNAALKIAVTTKYIKAEKFSRFKDTNLATKT